MSGTYTVRSLSGAAVCKPRGKFRLDQITPLVGDRVRFTGTTIKEVLPRRNEFARPPVANVDVAALIVSQAIPAADTYVLDLMISYAEQRDCEPLVVINKTDLDSADSLYKTYSASGFNVIRVSAVTGVGLAELRMAVNGKVCVFTGNSGVGKSSIINALSSMDLKVGEVSRKLGRGRHTTRHTELYELPAVDSMQTFIIDTAGFSKITEEGLTKDGIADTFREFRNYTGRCRFSDCIHIAEPECAVCKAVSAKEVPQTRYDSYVRMMQAAEYNEVHKYSGPKVKR